MTEGGPETSQGPEEQVLCRPLGPFLRRRRLKFILGFAFLLFHAAAVLIKGSPPLLRDVLQPPVDFYVDGLRMAATWGMFGSYHKPEAVYVVGVDKEGARHFIYPQRREERTIWDRLIDVRLRKMQSAYVSDEKANRARLYAAYWCKYPRPGATYETVRIEKGAGLDDEKHPRELILVEGCTPQGRRSAQRDNRRVRAQKKAEDAKKEKEKTEGKRDEQVEIE